MTTYADMETERRSTLYREMAESYRAMMSTPNLVFVFGSNRKGIHGGGAAKTAFDLYGAVWGQGEGLQGRSYAIPTKITPGQRFHTFHPVREHVERFLDYARSQPDTQFWVTRVGTGLAGWSEEDMMPLFANAPYNCILPENWR